MISVVGMRFLPGAVGGGGGARCAGSGRAGGSEPGAIPVSHENFCWLCALWLCLVTLAESIKIKVAWVQAVPVDCFQEKRRAMLLRCFWVLRPRRVPGSAWVPAAATATRPVRRGFVAAAAAVAARPRVASVLTLVCVAVGLPALVSPPLPPAAAPPPTVVASEPAPLLVPILFGPGPFVFSDGGGLVPPQGSDLPPGGPEGPGGPPGPVPEPSGLALVATALFGLALVWRFGNGRAVATRDHRVKRGETKIE